MWRKTKYWRDTLKFGSNSVQKKQQTLVEDRWNKAFLPQLKQHPRLHCFWRTTRGHEDWCCTRSVLPGHFSTLLRTFWTFISHLETGHTRLTEIPNILTDFKSMFLAEGSPVLFRWGPNSMAFCTKTAPICYEKLIFFTLFTSKSSSLLFFTCHSMENGLGCKWLVHVKFFLPSF